VCEPRRAYGAKHAPADRAEPYRGDAAEPKRAHAAEPLSPDEALDLGDRIADLARRIQVAEYELLCLIAEFDDHRAWAPAGFGSCAEWLTWRIGCKPNAARERVRAAHALEHLPKTSDAMQAGTLSFSKVRALTRVATPENEEALLEFAHGGSATNLERVVRAWKALDDREELALEQIRHRERTFSVFVGDDGSYIVKGRLEPEVGAVLMRAVEAAGDALFQREGAGERERGGEGDRDDERDRDDKRDRDDLREGRPDLESTPAQRRADAVGLLCERALAAGFDGGASGSRAERYQVMLHGEPATVRGDAESGRSDLDGVRVCAETSRRMTCDASLVEVLESPVGTGGCGDGVGRYSDEIGGERVTAVTSERRVAHAPLQANILGVGRRTRTIPPALRRALQSRDRGCRFPGCDGRFTDAHHVEHWADGGRTDLKNLVLLCRRHHRAVHEGGMRVCLDTEGKAAFFTPSGRAVFDAPRGGLPRGEVPRRGLPHGGLPRSQAPNGGTPNRSTAPPHTPFGPLPPAPPTAAYSGAAAAYPGAARWQHDRDIPWDIEARAREALDV
jgi:hypothetical protein